MESNKFNLTGLSCMYNYPQISSQDYEVLAAISSYFFCKRAEATLPKKRLSIVFERKGKPRFSHATPFNASVARQRICFLLQLRQQAKTCKMASRHARVHRLMKGLSIVRRICMFNPKRYIANCQ